MLMLMENNDVFTYVGELASEYHNNDCMLDFFMYDHSTFDGMDHEDVLVMIRNAVCSLFVFDNVRKCMNVLNTFNFTHEVFQKVVNKAAELSVENSCVDEWLNVISSFKTKLMNHNLSLVMEISLNYKNTVQIPIDDAIQAGMLGLSTAIDKYNPYVNTKLSTAAYSWIFQSIQRTNDTTSELIPTPCNIIEQNKKNKKIVNEMLSSGKYFPTPDEICEKSGNDSYLFSGKSYESLNSLVDNNLSLADRLEDVNVQSTIDLLEYANIKSRLVEIIATLPDTKKSIVEMMFGYNEHGEFYTNKAIIDKLGMDNYSFNKAKNSILEEFKDIVEYEFAFDNWQDVFAELGK